MRRIVMVISAILVLFGVQAEASQNCAAETWHYQQCAFTSPSLKHQQTRLVKTETSLGFAGEVAVACRNGKVQWGAASCEPAAADSCNIPATRFLSDKAVCGHSSHPEPLKNGAERRALDDQGNGEVLYRCTDGKLEAMSAQCGGQAAEIDAPITVQAQALLSTQNATSSKSGVHKFQIVTSRQPTTTEVLRQYTQFAAYDSRLTPTSRYINGTGNQQMYEISCPFQRSLTCDASVTNGQGSQYDPRTGEHTLPPTFAQMREICTRQGFSDIGEVLAVSKAFENVVDLFAVTTVCTGNASLCAGAPVKTESITVQPTSCTTATIVASNIKRTANNPPDSTLMTSWCNSKGFGTFTRANSFTVVDQYAGFMWYDVNLSCSNYSGTTPLQTGCGTPINNSYTGVSTDRQDCDTAIVSATFQGETHPLTQERNLPPARSTIEDVCKFAGYNVLDRIVGTEIINEGPPRLYYVQSLCSGYTGDKSACNAQDPCLGKVVPSGSATPHRCMADGVCYENLCVDTPIVDESFCADCDGAKGTLSANGNTCTVTMPLTKSGGSATFAFADTSFNGTATMTCNNGEVETATGSCYRSCPGGQTLRWQDKNGANSCSQVTPGGIHKQGDAVSFSNSQAHTGTAAFTCDNGNWIRGTNTCKLDCSGEITWGSGTAADGTNKTNLCRATIGTVKHAVQGNASSATTRTVGSTAYQCNDGNFDLSGSSCNLGCNATTVSWGGQCRASVPALGHTATAPVSHGSNPSYAFAASITGSATFRCSDGGVTLISGSCRYITGTRTGDWGAWSNTGTPYNCLAWSPDRSTVNQGVSFTQTRSCSQNQTRSRTIYDQWNSAPTETVNRTENGTQTISVSQSQPATGTKSVVTAREVGTWSSWVDIGGAYGCGTWSPSPSSVPTGVLFEQSRTCKQDQRRTRVWYDVWSNGSRTPASTETEERVIDRTQTREELGINEQSGVAPSACPSGFNESYVCWTSPTLASCPSGYQFSFSSGLSTTCRETVSSLPVRKICPLGTTRRDGSQYPDGFTCVSDGVLQCSLGDLYAPCYVQCYQGSHSPEPGAPFNDTRNACKASPNISCASGTLLNGQCYNTVTVSGSCPSGSIYSYVFMQGNACTMAKGEYCPSGTTLQNGFCR